MAADVINFALRGRIKQWVILLWGAFPLSWHCGDSRPHSQSLSFFRLGGGMVHYPRIFCSGCWCAVSALWFISWISSVFRSPFKKLACFYWCNFAYCRGAAPLEKQACFLARRAVQKTRSQVLTIFIRYRRKTTKALLAHPVGMAVDKILFLPIHN